MEQTENLTSAEPVNPALFAFDNPDGIEVGLIIIPDPDKPQFGYHRLRQPTKEEINEYASTEKTEYEQESKREERIIPGSDAAILKLWDKIAIAVKGYVKLPTPKDQWHTLRPEDKAGFRPSHKAAAIRALYAGSCEIERDEDGIGIGGDEWTVKQSIGMRRTDPDFIIRYRFREPNESERRAYRTEANTIKNSTGLKKPRQRVQSNLNVYAQTFDALLIDVIGGTVAGKTFRESDRAAFLDRIDRLYKRDIIQAMMLALEADIQD
jgi:hypothetical protein